MVLLEKFGLTNTSCVPWYGGKNKECATEHIGKCDQSRNMSKDFVVSYSRW